MVRKLLLAIAAGALIAAPLAHARDRWSGFMPSMQAQGQQGKKAPGQGQQFQRGERGKPQGGQQERGNQNRLSEEQRRELNRDLDRANREIYRR